MPRPFALFLTALQFLTRLPVPDPGWEDGRLRAALPAFPLVGLVVGGIGAAVWLGASDILPLPVAAGLALGIMLFVTGAMHEDGLGDVADGLGATRDRGRALEIMRDSRIGTYAAVVIVVSLGLRWTSLAAMTPDDGALALVIAAVVARGAMVAASALAGPARPDGLGRMLGEGAGPVGSGIALALALLASLAGGVAGLLALVAALLAMALVVRAMVRRVGGMTGDGYGAVAALAETAAMVTFAAAWGGT